MLVNDYVFVFAGGDPPYEFLKGIGIQFGSDKKESLQAPSASSAAR